MRLKAGREGNGIRLRRGPEGGTEGREPQIFGDEDVVPALPGEVDASFPSAPAGSGDALGA